MNEEKDETEDERKIKTGQEEDSEDIIKGGRLEDERN